MDFFFPWPKELRVGRGCFQYTAVASAAILLTMNAQPCAVPPGFPGRDIRGPTPVRALERGGPNNVVDRLRG